MKNNKTTRWIDSIIKKSGLSLAEFARKYGWAYRTIQDLRLGTRRPSGPSTALLNRIEAELNDPKQV